MGRSRVVTMADDTEGLPSLSQEMSLNEHAINDAPRVVQRGGKEVLAHEKAKPKKDQSERKIKQDNSFRKRVVQPPRFGGPLDLEELPKKAIASDSEKMKKIFQMLRWHPLEPGYHGGVPYVINFFFYLWAVDEVFDRSMLGRGWHGVGYRLFTRVCTRREDSVVLPYLSLSRTTHRRVALYAVCHLRGLHAHNTHTHTLFTSRHFAVKTPIDDPRHPA